MCIKFKQKLASVDNVVRRGDGFVGRLRLFGKVYYTSIKPTKAEAQAALNEYRRAMR